MKPPTRAPFFACMYHALCGTAREHGYALSIHGTVTSDLDLVAIPWTDEAVSAEELKDALMKHINACDYEESLRRFGLPEDQIKQIMARNDPGTRATGTQKPHGRLAWNLYFEYGCKVDLSVMPRSTDLRDEVRTLLSLMNMIDPHGGETRHPEWPLQIRGDGDATGDLCACLNRLQDLTR